MRNLALLVIAFVLLACSGGNECKDEVCGSAHAFGTGGAGSGGNGASGGSGGTGPSVPPPEGPFPTPNEGAAACEQPGEVIAELKSVADTNSWLTRRWVYCSGDNLFQTPHDGIEFASDGRWYFLDLVAGELVPRQGFAGGGDWGTMDTGYNVQVNIDSWKGYGSGGFLRFAVSPLQVSINFGAEKPAVYVAVAPLPL